MAKLSTEKRKQLPDSAFGIPEKRMYPLYKLDEKDNLVPDKAHIESAVKLFGHASDADKPKLARNILKAAHEAGMDTSGWDKVNAWAKKESTKKTESKPVAEQHVGIHEYTGKLSPSSSGMSLFDNIIAYADDVLENLEMAYYEYTVMMFPELLTMEQTAFIQIGNDMLITDEDYESFYEEAFLNDIDDGVIIEFDLFTEAAQGPYDAYLKAHQYDPKTNTLIIDGKRVSAGKVGSKKQRNRMNAFLKRNGYDPKTETIETDMVDENGKRRRVPFVMHTPDTTMFGFDPGSGMKGTTVERRAEDREMSRQGRDLEDRIYDRIEQLQQLRDSLEQQVQSAQSLDEIDALRKRITDIDKTIWMMNDQIGLYNDRLDEVQAKPDRTATISMQPRVLQSRAADDILKHEEGHIAHGDVDGAATEPVQPEDAEFAQYATGLARAEAEEMGYEDPLPEGSHGAEPAEYAADRYAVQHSRKRTSSGSVGEMQRQTARFGQYMQKSGATQDDIDAMQRASDAEAMLRGGNMARLAYEQKRKEIADQEYRRQLAIEQLKQQLASGQLTPTQAQKAQKKLSRLTGYTPAVTITDDGPAVMAPRKSNSPTKRAASDITRKRLAADRAEAEARRRAPRGRTVTQKPLYTDSNGIPVIAQTTSMGEPAEYASYRKKANQAEERYRQALGRLPSEEAQSREVGQLSRSGQRKLQRSISQANRDMLGQAVSSDFNAQRTPGRTGTRSTVTPVEPTSSNAAFIGTKQPGPKKPTPTNSDKK